MSVYFIQRLGDQRGLIKIGFAENVQTRVRDLACAVPEGIVVLASAHGTQALERLLHGRLAQFRVAGEWFDPAPEVMEFVGRAKAGEDLMVLVRDAQTAKLRGRKVSGISPDLPDEIKVIVEAHGINEALAASFFCLRELTVREHRGPDDTWQSARDRVCVAIGLEPSYGKRLWHRFHTMNDVSGNALVKLMPALAHALRSEGQTVKYFERWLKTEERLQALREDRACD